MPPCCVVDARGRRAFSLVGRRIARSKLFGGRSFPKGQGRFFRDRSVSSYVAGLPVGNWAAPMTARDARLESLVVVCDGQSPITTTAVVDGSICFPPVESLNDAATVLFVQFYLRCKRARLPTMPHEDKAWEWFFARCDPVVRRSLASYGRAAALLAHRDDLRQEVWGEVLDTLPRPDRDHIREGIEPWLAGLARRKAWRIARSLAKVATDRLGVLDDFEESLSGSELGPEDICLLREAADRFCEAVADDPRRGEQRGRLAGSSQV